MILSAGSRGARCLCKHFDIPIIQNDDTPKKHRVATYMMVAASQAHYQFREQTKIEAFKSNVKQYNNARDFIGGSLQATTIKKCLANSALTRI